jgi:hypothetical protein
MDDLPSCDFSVPLVDKEIQPVPKPKPTRKRLNEFDETGEWSDVRRFDRMPITTDAAVSRYFHS